MRSASGGCDGWCGCGGGLGGGSVAALTVSKRSAPLTGSTPTTVGGCSAAVCSIL